MRARLRRRRRADPRADRRRRPRPRVPHRRPARAPPTARLPVADYEALVRHAAAGAARRGVRDVGPAARRVVRRRRRLRRRRPAARQRLRRHPAAARLRREPGRDLPRPRAAARPPLPRRLPLAASEASAPTRSCTSASTARSSGCPARGSGCRPRCAPDAALGDVPLFYPFVVNDPGEGMQAKRRAHAVVDRPPRAADDARGDLRRARPARAAARRVRALRGARPGEAAGARAPHLVAAARGRAAPRPRASRTPSSRRRGLRRADPARRRLPVRDQGPPGPRRPAHPRPGAGGRAVRRAAGGDPAPRRRASGVPGLRRAIGAAFGLDEPALLDDAGGRGRTTPPPALLARFPGPAATARRPRRPAAGRPGRAARRRSRADGFDPDARRSGCARRCWAATDAGVASCPALRRARRSCRGCWRTADEMPDLLARAPRPPRPGGPVGLAHPRARSTCCRPAATSTPSTPGRCPATSPTTSGARLADALLAATWRGRRVPRDGRDRGVGHGRDAHPRRRRRRDPRAARRAARLAPRDAPGRRARADRARGARAARGSTSRCASRASSATPSPRWSTLLDDAVTLVAGLDEPPSATSCASTRWPTATALRRRAGRGRRLAARDHAHLRRPSRAPTARGCCRSSTTRNWRDDADLAEVYEAWGGHAYGRGLDGVEARAAMREPVRPHRRRGQERRHARARPARLERLLRRARRDGRLRPPPRRRRPAGR